MTSSDRREPADHPEPAPVDRPADRARRVAAQEAAARREFGRVAAVCDGCRRCVERCDVFPRLIDLLDRVDGRDPGRLTPDEQDRVAVRCFHCQACLASCPYGPDLHPAAVDVPRVMVRFAETRRAAGRLGMRERFAARLVHHPRRLAALAGSSPPGSWRRRAVAVATGVSARRALPPLTDERFTVWFGRRSVTGTPPEVLIVGSCDLEHHHPEIGRSLVALYERAGLECALVEIGGCGASLLSAGDRVGFARVATANARALASALRRADDARTDGQATELVVTDPTCASMLRRYAVEAVDGAARHDAELVADRTRTATGHVTGLVRSGRIAPPPVDRRELVLHVPGHAGIDPDADADGTALLEMLGLRVAAIDLGSGVAGGWGLAAAHDDVVAAAIGRLGSAIAAADPAGTAELAGTSTASNHAIAAATGRCPVHPITVVAGSFAAVD